MGIDGSELIRRGKRRASSKQSSEHTQAAEQADTGSAGTEPSRTDVLLGLLSSDDGWLRVVPADSGRTVYCKWKWTSGRLANRYVMTVGPVEQVFDLLEVLGRKREAAEAGKGPSAKDRYYHS